MAKLLLLAVLTVLLSAVNSASITCPNSRVIHPCTCKRVAYGLQIKCMDIKSDAILKKVFNILLDYHVHTILLHNLFIEEILPSNMFDGLNIKEIKIEKSKLRFDSPAFAGLDDSLYILNVAQHSMIKYNGSFSLSKLDKLDELDVQSNSIPQIRDVWLTGKVPSVTKLVLDFDQIELVEDHAFASLPLLQHISLSDNRIKYVKRSMFPIPATHLKRIDLSFNSITNLPTDIFSHMPNLKEVILSGNNIRTLDEKTWSSVWPQLNQVFLVDNHLECDEKMDWIKTMIHPYQLDGTCSGPKGMAGRSLKDVYPQRSPAKRTTWRR